MQLLLTQILCRKGIHKLENRGVTIPEMLISAVLMTLILGVGYKFFISSQRSFQTGEAKYKIQHEAQMVIEQLKVDLLHAVSGVGQCLGQISIVGQQQSPGGTHVQSTDREQPGFNPLHQVEYGVPSLRITGGSYHPPRLVEQHGDRSLGGDNSSVDFDLVPCRVGLGSERGYYPTVDPHPAVADVLLGLAT